MFFKSVLSAILTIFSLSVMSLAQGSLPDLGIQKEKNLAVGIVKTASQEKLVIETKDGSIDAIILKVTAYKRLPPDKLSLKAATEAKLEDVSTGDRVLLVGKIADDKKSMQTKTVYLVKSSDVQAKLEKEKQEWITRGISGRVKEVDAEGKVITLEMPSIAGTSSSVEISPKEGIKYLRYAPNSIKYKDAVASSIAEIKKGDMLRALGDRSEDKKSFKAEQILYGSFLTVAGKVKSVNAEKNEVTITDLKTKKDVTIAVNAESVVKKFPEEVAQRLARMQMMMRMRAAMNAKDGKSGATKGQGETKERGDRAGQRPGGGENRGQRAGRGGEGRRPGMGRGGGRRGQMDINEMLKRFPTIKVSDLKPGDMIAASSPKGDDPNRLTAIKLLAGVEPFLTTQTFSGGRRGSRGGRGGRGRGGGDGDGDGFSIPGLNGVNF